MGIVMEAEFHSYSVFSNNLHTNLTELLLFIHMTETCTPIFPLSQTQQKQSYFLSFFKLSLCFASSIAIYSVKINIADSAFSTIKT